MTRYGPHSPATAPSTTRDGLDLHPDIIEQRRQLNDIAAGVAVPSKAAVLASVNAAASDDDKARIDAAILSVARRGGVFSANDFRDMFPDISGGVVGARVNALARKHFVHVGYVASTKGNTNGHEIKTWQLRSAVAA